MKRVKTNFRQSVNSLNLGGLPPSHYKSVTGGLTDVQMDFGIVNDLDTQGYYVLQFGTFTVPIMVEPNIDSGAIGGAVVNDLDYDFGILV